jgi:hypothetical protein
MGYAPDRVGHAYATLGLRRGCSRREAARRYKQLVKQWHPDQYANDPQGQAEASARMREINAAYAMVRKLASPEVRVRSVAEKPTASSPVQRAGTGRRLTQEEIDDIAKAIGGPGIIDTLMRYFFWFGAVGYGYLLVAQPTKVARPRNTANTIAGILLVCAGVGHWIYTRWFRKD